MAQDGESPDSDSIADMDDQAMPGAAGPQAEGTEHAGSHTRLALLAGALVAVVLAGLAGWLEYRNYKAHRIEQVRELFLRVGRQGALDLTTISHSEVDADVQRILNSSVDTFHEDFEQRSQPFVDLVKRDQSISKGTITEAGVQSMTSDSARVVVAVSVRTTTAAVSEPRVNNFRMRVDVKKVGDGAMVSNVEFIS